MDSPVKSECGIPVFNNVDEVLTGKITHHSVTHSDTSTPSADSPDTQHASSPRHSCAPTGNVTTRLLQISIVILLLITISLLVNRRTTLYEK